MAERVSGEPKAPAPTVEQWRRHLLPLPHEISFGGTASCKSEEVAVRVVEGAGQVELRAAAALEELFSLQRGRIPAGSRFEILLGRVDSQGRVGGRPLALAHRLKALPNRDQAYVIEPLGDHGLALAGLEEKGVCYAARTLCQLLRPMLGAEQLTIPLVSIVDWPDLAERGLWNFPAPATWIPWLSSLKLNYGKMSDTRLSRVERGRPNRAQIEGGLLEASRLQGFNYVPYILHLNFLHGIGLFAAYP